MRIQRNTFDQKISLGLRALALVSEKAAQSHTDSLEQYATLIYLTYVILLSFFVVFFYSIDRINELKRTVSRGKGYMNRWLFLIDHHILLTIVLYDR